jgi:hypothetical protein
LTAALATANVDPFDQLNSALTVADDVNVNQELMNTARTLLINLRKEKAMIDEGKGSLQSALSYEMVPSLAEALETAASIGYAGAEVGEAQAL